MRPSRSLEFQLVARIFSILVAAFLIFSAIIYYRSNTVSREINEKFLETTALGLSRSIVKDAKGALSLKLSPEFAEDLQDDPYTTIFIIKSVDGKWRWISDRRLNDISLDWGIDEDDGYYSVLNNIFKAGDVFYGISRTYTNENGSFFINVASSGDKLDFSNLILSQFIEDVSWAVPGLFLVIIGTIIFTIRNGLRSISRTSDMVANIAPNATDIRLASDGVPKEIVPLVNAVNRAFQRLDDGFQAERRFTANAAHELRTPLAILKARVDALPRDDASRDIVSELKQDLDRMARVVSQLLAIARLETPHVAADDHSVLNDVVKDVVAALAPLAIAKRQEISARLPPGAVTVAVPYTQLYEALRNLVENAIEHCGPGTEITVSLEAGGQIEVTDNGPGVPDAEKELVFERFFRRTRSSAKAGGAGLGLSIVAEIVKQHGGSIAAGDTPGGGTVMTMVLPLIRG